MIKGHPDTYLEVGKYFRNLIKQSKHKGFVYAMQDIPNRIYTKIGKSILPWDRFIAIQSMLPFEILISMLASGDKYSYMEEILHKRYKPYCVRGEWFKLPKDSYNGIVDIIRLNDLNLLHFEAKKGRIK